MIERFDTCCSLSESDVHYDSLIFPNRSNWFYLLEAHVLASSREVLVYRASSDGNNSDCVVLAMIRDRSGALGEKRLNALQNFYTPDFRPLCTSRAAIRNINTLVIRMLEDESPDVVSLSPLDADSLETVELQKALTQAGYSLKSRPYLVNWIHDVDGNFKQYIAGRPRRVRNTLKRRARKLSSVPEVSIEICDGSKELTRLLDWYESVYSRSWKKPEPHPQFMPALITNSAEVGELRLGFVSISRQPIAMHCWIVSDQCAFIYKLAHDQEFDKLSAGSVLMAEMLKHVIDVDKVTRIDFLTGDDSYKRDWMTQRRIKIELRAYNQRSWRGKLISIVESYIKPFVKRLRNWLLDARIILRG